MESFDSDKVRDVLTLPNVRLSEYNGKRTISMTRDAELKLNVNTTKTNVLKQWFESKNHELINNIISKREMSGVEFKSIQLLNEQLPLTAVNVIGVCFDIGELIVFTNEKSERELKQRKITIVDKSTSLIILSVWNDEAIKFEKNTLILFYQ